MEKGCVYFFKHIGLSPVKIGYSESESPINRFNQFNTFAPYGAEIIGFIQTINAKKLELMLHHKFSNKRLRGEWFELTEEEIKKEIDFHSNIEDVRERAEFQLNFAKYLEEKKTKINEIKKESYEITTKEKFRKLFIENNKKLNITKVSKDLKISRKTLYLWIKQINLEF